MYYSLVHCVVHLSNALETLLKPAEANVILALHRIEGEMTGRRIASVTGSPSASSTLRTLRHLVRGGILRARSEPTAIYYSINDQHLLWPAIESIIESRSELAARIRTLTDRESPGSSVIIYGSTARNSSASDSDIDVLVLHPDHRDAGERDAFGASLASSVTTWTGNRTEVYDLTKSQLQHMVDTRDPMIDSWRRSHELVAGDLPDVLAGR